MATKQQFTSYSTVIHSGKPQTNLPYQPTITPINSQLRPFDPQITPLNAQTMSSNVQMFQQNFTHPTNQSQINDNK